MKYTTLSLLPAHEFRRLTGVKKKTFELMATTVKSVEAKRKKAPGRPMKLRIEDQILLMLEYLREYRTYFHIGINYGLNESNCFRTIRRIENILVKSKVFALPPRATALYNPAIEKVTLDCTESPVERPKKNSADTTPERKRGIPSRRK